MKIGYLMQEGVPDVRNPSAGGPAIHVSQVITELRSLGHKVRLAEKLGDSIYLSDDLEHYREILLTPKLFERFVRRLQSILRLPYANFFDSLRFVIGCKNELSNFDILYERMGWTGYGGVMLAKLLKVPLVLEINGDHLSELSARGIAPQGLQRSIAVFLMKQAVQRADFHIAAGEGWKQQHVQRWGIDPSRVCVIESGSQFVSLLERDRLGCFSGGGQKDHVTVLYIGGFEPWHGVDIFVTAFARAKPRVKKIQMKALLIGSGKGQQAVEQLVMELGLSQDIEFTGHLSIDAMIPYLYQADIGVSPYCGRAEFSGLKLLDYKAAGLAIIASGKDGQPGVIEHGQTGWIVPPCEEEALCNAIVQLAYNAQLRRTLGQNARLEAEVLHSWKNTAIQIEQVLKNIVPKSSSIS